MSRKVLDVSQLVRGRAELTTAENHTVEVFGTEVPLIVIDTELDCAKFAEPPTTDGTHLVEITFDGTDADSREDVLAVMPVSFPTHVNASHVSNYVVINGARNCTITAPANPVPAVDFINGASGEIALMNEAGDVVLARIRLDRATQFQLTPGLDGSVEMLADHGVVSVMKHPDLDLRIEEAQHLAPGTVVECDDIETLEPAQPPEPTSRNELSGIEMLRRVDDLDAEHSATDRAAPDIDAFDDPGGFGLDAI